MKKHTLYILICLTMSSFILSGCLKDDNIEPTPLAGLTMINGYPDDLGVIYYADRQAILPLEYQSFAGVGLVTGNRNIIIKEYSSPQILADTTFIFQDSTYYSSFIFGTTNKPMQVFTEDRAIQSLQNAGIRFFNLSTDVNSRVSLQIGDQSLQPSFQNRAVENQTSAIANQGFITQSSGTFTLSIRDESGNVIATRGSVVLNTESYYSIILIGKMNNTATPLFIGVIDQAAN